MAGAMRFRPPNWRARIEDRRPPATGALQIELDDLRRARARVLERRRILGWPPTRSPRSTSPRRWPNARRKAAGAGRRSTIRSLRIEGGRHPVVEARSCAKAASPSSPTTARPVSSGSRRRSGAIWLVTGPNMAGKSTFLRQNALIAMLAQRVPSCRQGGAYRHRRPAVLARRRGRRSRARPLDLHGRDGRDRGDPQPGDPRSLVILDEIGRGTATFDGLSIAWATLEHLHETNRCRALFATHFTS
jgi:hypothetical protein